MTHDSPHSADDNTGASDFEDPNDPLQPEITVSELKRAQAEPLAEEPVLQGEDMGKYVLVGELAKGGMAELLLAVHKGPEGFLKVVVVKRVLPHLVESPDFVRMFADEARIAARLDHPNIVRTYEFGTSEGNYFTVMEYLAGEDLGNIQRRLAISAQSMSIVGACAIIRDVCKGLHFAHDLTDTSGAPMELVHRDVNPSNLVVTYAGEVKIVDFGVAKTTINTSKTMVGTIKGKSAYMAPEHLLARGIDRRADVFSAGIVLWELLTGMSLFARDTDAATMFAIMNDPIPPPSRYRTEVPPALDAICARALARTPADRYDSMEQLQGALEDFIASQPRLATRYLADLIESLFGTTRAEAKRAISRAQGLSRNISLVMKLRTDVRVELAARLQASLEDPPLPALASAPVAATPARSRVPYLIGGVLLVAISAALLFIGTREPAAKSIAVTAPTTATLKVTSKPTGAAVFVNGEPTGYTTPVTLDQLSPGKVTVRVEVAGHEAGEAVVTVGAGGAEKAFELVERQARLVIAGLPAAANVIVGGSSYPAGEAIVLPVGPHEVTVVVDGHELLRQSIEVKVGDQVWERQGERLVSK